MVIYTVLLHFGYLRSTDLPCFALVLWLRIVVVVKLGEKCAAAQTQTGASTIVSALMLRGEHCMGWLYILRRDQSEIGYGTSIGHFKKWM